MSEINPEPMKPFVFHGDEGKLVSVNARFALSEDKRVRYWVDGKYVEALRVELIPVKGEPFGPATPDGRLEMLIVNSLAIEMFKKATLGQEFNILIYPSDLSF